MENMYTDVSLALCHVVAQHSLSQYSHYYKHSHKIEPSLSCLDQTRWNTSGIKYEQILSPHFLCVYVIF